MGASLSFSPWVLQGAVSSAAPSPQVNSSSGGGGGGWPPPCPFGGGGGGTEMQALFLRLMWSPQRDGQWVHGPQMPHQALDQSKSYQGMLLSHITSYRRAPWRSQTPPGWRPPRRILPLPRSSSSSSWFRLRRSGRCKGSRNAKRPSCPQFPALKEILSPTIAILRRQSFDLLRHRVPLVKLDILTSLQGGGPASSSSSGNKSSSQSTSPPPPPPPPPPTANCQITTAKSAAANARRPILSRLTSW